MVWVNLPSPQFVLKDISCIITLYFALFLNYVLCRLGLLGQDITSACSSDTYMTVCRIVLQGGGGACQCYKLMLRRVSAITNRKDCTDSYMMTLGNWNGPGYILGGNIWRFPNVSLP